MKIRTGFVSNSSSSSFCIFGATFLPEEIARKNINNTEFLKSIGMEDHELELDQLERYDVALECVRECYSDIKIPRLSMHTACRRIPDEQLLFIGVYPEAINEDKTLREIRKELVDGLQELTGRHDIKIQWLQESYWS